jgi:hypothetical protein
MQEKVMIDFILAFLASCGALHLGFLIGQCAARYIVRRLEG